MRIEECLLLEISCYEGGAKQLAIDSGISFTSLFRLMKGQRKLTLGTVQLLCNVLGLELNKVQEAVKKPARRKKRRKGKRPPKLPLDLAAAAAGIAAMQRLRPGGEGIESNRTAAAGELVKPDCIDQGVWDQVTGTAQIADPPPPPEACEGIPGFPHKKPGKTKVARKGRKPKLSDGKSANGADCQEANGDLP